MKSSPRNPFVRATLLVSVVLACAAPAAQAAHWPGYGSDPGRSGNQPVDPGVAPLVPVWNAADGAVKTSLTTSGGTDQRVAYGTADGVVHIRRLADGAPVGDPSGTDIGDDADVFGPVSTVPGENRASTSPTKTSESSGAARVKTSSLAFQPSMRSGSPARRKRRSYASRSTRTVS